MQLATPCILYLSDALMSMTLAPIQRPRAIQRPFAASLNTSKASSAAPAMAFCTSPRCRLRRSPESQRALARGSRWLPRPLRH